MSSDLQAAETKAPPLPALDRFERRVLGVLVEKAKTTPDVYPMSVNSLLTGCNQKSTRDPVMDMTEVDVEDALASTQQKGLTIKITGSRVLRWRHNLYEAWHVGKVELAILAELLLRGPQTEGELRGRANRMEPIDDLDALRAVLKPMSERGLVVYLSPEGRRGTVLTDGLRPAEELEYLRKTAGTERDEGPVASSSARPAVVRPDLEMQVAECRTEIAALREQVNQLQSAMKALSERFQALGG